MCYTHIQFRETKIVPSYLIIQFHQYALCRDIIGVYIEITANTNIVPRDQQNAKKYKLFVQTYRSSIQTDNWSKL